MSEKELTEKEDIKQEELDQLDDDLHAIEMLYKSRCVQAPMGSNVKVREIKEDE